MENSLNKYDFAIDCIKLNIKILNSFKEHFDKLLKDNVISNNKYQNSIDKIKFLITESNCQIKMLNQIKKIELINSDNIEWLNLETNIANISAEIIKLIYSNGFVSIIEIFLIIDNSLYLRNLNKINEKLNIIDKFYQVTRVDKNLDLIMIDDVRIKIIDENSNSNSNSNSDSNSDSNLNFNPFKPKQINDDNKKKSKSSSNFKKIGDIETQFMEEDKIKLNLIWELSNVKIELKIENCTFLFDGYFKEDTFNEIFLQLDYEKKYIEIYKNFKNKLDISPGSSNLNSIDVSLNLTSDDKIKIFFQEYMNQINLKDFIVNSSKMISEKIYCDYVSNLKFSKLSILDLLNEFLNANLFEKRNIIILLLLNDIANDSLFNNILDKNLLNDVTEPIESNNQIKPDDSTNSTNSTNLTNSNDLNDSNDSNDSNDLKDLNDSNDSNILNIQDTIAELKNPIKKKNPLPLVKLNKITATRYTINSIMKNFDSTGNEIKNLTNILANSKKILNANILMDFMKNNLLKSYEYENFKNSIHWNCRKKIFAKSALDDKPIGPVEEMSWETKLNFMPINDKTKDKVMEKIKEVKSSKDNAKAETFIENFFKIPFGKYIKEDIFIKSLNSDIKIKKLVENINNYIDVQKDKIKISDSIETIKIKTLPYRLVLDIENYYWDLIEEKKYILKEKNMYLESVDKILDNAIYGHLESKREIKRLIAQWMGGKMEGAVLGFYGPPGVGKTCFAKKGIAKCLFDSEGKPRPFCILQLGGATDGAILEGHSYTYVGAKPGRLVEFLQETKCMNPIIYFDELDKVSESDKGKEIIDILIHLTDKSQNSEIFDKYFSGIELDFSKSIIIFSYNDASKVNRILRDRITEIKINPLKKHEKIIITQKYTLKEISEELNFSCELSTDLIEYIIDTFTFEPGIRKLNEKLYEIFREINLRSLENNSESINIDVNLIDEILTRHYKMKYYQIHLEPKVGLINGLYATTTGLGGITLIQIKKILTASNSIPLELTGQQGDVMKESMSCAKTLALNLLTESEKSSISEELKSNSFGLHIHCPDGATPKDGPSAGITITTGIYSVLTNKQIRNDIAMTGEVDLMGNVKAIGGLDAKINGAIKAGVKLVIFPKENEQDWEKILKNNSLDGSIEIFMAEHINQVIQKAII